MIYELFRWIGLISGYPLQLLFFKRKTYYEDKSEQGRRVRGGALVISNHYSPLDYVMNMFLFPFRKLHVVMSEVTFRGRKKKLYKFLTKFHGGICSDRDIMGMKFIDDSVEVIENGGLVQIFPEAHITADGDMHKFKTSYLMIALRSDAPIIPVIIPWGICAFMPLNAFISYGVSLP